MKLFHEITYPSVCLRLFCNSFLLSAHFRGKIILYFENVSNLTQVYYDNFNKKFFAKIVIQKLMIQLFFLQKEALRNESVNYPISNLLLKKVCHALHECKIINIKIIVNYALFLHYFGIRFL